MGVVSFAWILSAVLALCVLWLRAIGLFGQRPDLGQAAWQGAACVLLLGFGVLTNLPALAFRKAAATPQVEATHLMRALRQATDASDEVLEIPRRNIETMRNLGREQILKRLLTLDAGH
jgi:hypothetical protein